MFSSDKNVENLSKLILQIKDFVELKIKFARYDIVLKGTSLLSAFIIVPILLLIALFILLMFAICIAIWIGQSIENYALGFVFVTILLLLVGIGVYAFRKPLIFTPVSRFVCNMMLENEYETEKEEKE